MLHPLTIITVSLCLWERPPPFLYSNFCKSFLRIFQFHHPTPPQSHSQSRWRLSIKWQPPPLCAPYIAWNLTFFTHTSFFLTLFVFHTSRSSSWALLWFCPAFCFIISHTWLDKHTLSCLETHTHSNADWLDPDVFRHLFSGHLTLQSLADKVNSLWNGVTKHSRKEALSKSFCLSTGWLGLDWERAFANDHMPVSDTMKCNIRLKHHNTNHEQVSSHYSCCWKLTVSWNLHYRLLSLLMGVFT